MDEPTGRETGFGIWFLILQVTSCVDWASHFTCHPLQDREH